MNRQIRVLVVDDEPLLRRLVPAQLAQSGIEAAAVASGEDALSVLRATDYDVVLLDVQMPGLSGLEVLRKIRQMTDAPEVIMLTADASLTTGIEAMRRGAYDYLAKPSAPDQMEAVVRKADEKRRLVRQNASLRSAVRPPTDTGNDDIDSIVIIHRSEQMRRLVAQAETATQRDSTILITGESGTGKGVLARFIHARSPRHDAPMLTVSCGALPDTLFESEFFGHERGSFTGATSLKRGLIEAADGSTLFLDEIGETPLASQVKLLEFLESGRFRRIGATRDQSADVRIIAATNRVLELAVQEKKFRPDLFYRLNVVSFHVPPLRERPEDIPALIDYFLVVYRRRFNRPLLDLTEAARRQLMLHTWPGNVRELRNTFERAAALTTNDNLDAEHILPSPDLHANQSDSQSLFAEQPDQVSINDTPTLEQLNRQHILRTVAMTAGNRERAAAILGISERTLYRKLREYDSTSSSALPSNLIKN